MLFTDDRLVTRETQPKSIVQRLYFQFAKIIKINDAFALHID